MCLLGALAHHTPNVSEIARKLVKSLPYCNRNGHGPVVYFAAFLSLVTSYCIVVGQIVKTAPPNPNGKCLSTSLLGGS